MLENEEVDHLSSGWVRVFIIITIIISAEANPGLPAPGSSPRVIMAQKGREGTGRNL